MGIGFKSLLSLMELIQLVQVQIQIFVVILNTEWSHVHLMMGLRLA